MNVLWNIASHISPIEEQITGTTLHLLLAVHAEDKVFTVIRVIGHVDAACGIAFIVDIVGGNFAIDVLGEVAAQIYRIEEQRISTLIDSPLTRDANDELLATGRMVPQVVSGGVAIVVDFFLNL